MVEYKRISCEGCKFDKQSCNLPKGAQCERSVCDDNCRFFIMPNECIECSNYNKWEPACGMKFDTGKERWDLVEWGPFKEVVKVMTYGANKYAPNNWKGVEVKRYWAALFRHLTAYLMGETYDQESGLPHLSHAACNLKFIMWKTMFEPTINQPTKGEKNSNT